MNISYAAKGTGAATVYKISVTKLELCETGSTLSNCLNPITVSNPGLTTDVDLASITAGEAAATLGNFGLATAGTTYTYLQATMSRAITDAVCSDRWLAEPFTSSFASSFFRLKRR